MSFFIQAKAHLFHIDHRNDGKTSHILYCNYTQRRGTSSGSGSGRGRVQNNTEGGTPGVASVIVFLGSWDLTKVRLNFYSFLAKTTVLRKYRPLMEKDGFLNGASLYAVKFILLFNHILYL